MACFLPIQFWESDNLLLFHPLSVPFRVTFRHWKSVWVAKNILGINSWGRKWAWVEKIFGLWCRPDKTLANSRLIAIRVVLCWARMVKLSYPDLAQPQNRCYLQSGSFLQLRQIVKEPTVGGCLLITLEGWYGSCIFVFITHIGSWWVWKRLESRLINSCNLWVLNWKLFLDHLLSPETVVAELSWYLGQPVCLGKSSVVFQGPRAILEVFPLGLAPSTWR